MMLHFVFKFTILNQLDAIGINTYLIFLIGNICFSIAAVLVDRSVKIKNAGVDVIQQNNFQFNISFRIILVALILIGLPFYIQAAFQIFLASKAEDFFSGLRYELSYGDADIGPLKYLMPLAFVVYAVCLYEFHKQKNAANWVMLIASFLSIVTYSVFATGRTYFFIILSIYIGISFFVNATFSIKKYLALLGFFLLFFMAVGIIYGKGGNTEDSFSDNLKGASENVGIYLVTSLNALDIETNQNSVVSTDGDNTLRFFIKIGMSLNLLSNRKITDLKQEFVFVPYPTNVYTFYSPYIRDFGKLYAWIMLALFSVLHTWLFIKASATKQVRFIFYYAFLLFPLLLSFFGDQYLSLFSFWIQMLVITEMILLSNKLFEIKKW